MNTTPAAATVAAESYKGHDLAITERTLTYTYNHTTGETRERLDRSAVIDGRSFRCPTGTVEQVTAKLRKTVDTWIADDEILPSLLAVVANVEPGPVVDALAEGAVVAVHAMGYWRVGIVTAVKRTRVEVAYTTASSGGRVFRKAVPYGEVRAASTAAPVTADAAAPAVEVVIPETGEVVALDMAEVAEAVDAVFEPATVHATREAWLNAAVEALRPVFLTLAQAELPAELLVSVGWPGGKSIRKVIGQCWAASTAAGTPHLYVSPMLGADPVDLLGCLVHELIHAWDDCKSQHKGAFLKAFRALGMTGKATECAVGDELRPILADIAAQLGAYPHKAVTLAEVDAQPKQTTRMLKVECGADGYTVRMTRKWLDELGAPTCPCGERMVEVVK